MNKKEITNEVLKELKNLELDPEIAYKLWWWPKGLRLTRKGHLAFSKVITPHHFPCELRQTGRTLQKLLKIQSPFYVNFKEDEIIIYGDKLATMIKLYPSIERYLDIIQEDM